MRLQRYFPSTTAEQVQWLLNFANQLPAWQSALGLSDAELAAAVADARWVAYVIGSWREAADTFAAAAPESRKLVLHGEGLAQLPVFTPPPLPAGVVAVPNGALDRLFRRVQFLKIHPGCTETVAQSLGIVTRPEPVRPMPRFRLKAVRSATGAPEVSIGFSSYGHEAVWIASRRNGGKEEALGIGGATPWFDRRPLLVPGQAETREYRLRFWDKGEPTGDWTPWRTIAVAP